MRRLGEAAAVGQAAPDLRVEREEASEAAPLRHPRRERLDLHHLRKDPHGNLMRHE
jgi:hypothetical protein